MANAQASVVATLAAVARSAVERAVEGRMRTPQGQPYQLFTPAERQRLADALAAAVGPAELLGRARVRERAGEVPADG